MTAAMLKAPIHLVRRLAGLSPAGFGWIGIEIGASSATFAQVRRDGTEWSLAARWRLENEPIEPGPESAAPADRRAEEATPNDMNEAGPPETRESAARDPGIRPTARRDELRRIRAMMAGKNAAICLATASTVLRTLELPDGSEEDQADMIRQELANDDDAEGAAMEVDAWPADDGQAGAKRNQLTAVAVRSDVSDGVAEELFRAGYHPRILDAAPSAMARAVRLCDPYCDEPTVALKIDEDSALFVLIRNGRPGFCRMLRGCGRRSLAEPLVAKLGMNAEECRQVLARHGIPAGAAAGESSTDPFFRLIAIPLEKLVDELKRTLAFLDHGKPAERPTRVWLFGDGAAVRNLPTFLATRSGLPTVGWSPTFPAAGPVDDVRFGVAAGLSALAWEV